MHLLGLGNLYNSVENGPPKVTGRISRRFTLWRVCIIEYLWSEKVNVSLDMSMSYNAADSIEGMIQPDMRKQVFDTVESCSLSRSQPVQSDWSLV